MKKLILSLAALSLLLTACNPDDENVTPTAVVEGELKGEITANKEYAKGNYKLSGYVKIKSGVTVTFAAGSVITADKTDDTTMDALVVEKGGILNIRGTAAEPVIFTEKSKEAGSWGGIVIYGDAPIVAGIDKTTGAPITTAKSEDGLAIIYGGSKSDDTSGSLEYVRVEYAGKKTADGTKELNSFSFYAVGSKTVLKNLVAYKSTDDGFEFYGGTVSAQNLISYGNTDDSFDWQDGWRGQDNKNWYAYQTGIGNFGMEIEAKGVNNDFGPKVTDITLKRAANTTTEGGSSAAEYDAIQFKKQGNGDYSNVLVEGYTTEGAATIRIQDVETNDNQAAKSKIKISKLKIVGATPKLGGAVIKVDGKPDVIVTPNFPEGTITTDATATGATLTTGAWSIVGSENLIK